MTDQVKNGADVELELGGQKVNLRNVKSLNTLATVATLMVVVLIAYGGYMHTQETKEGSQAFVGAIKEQTTALREQTQVMKENNCIQTYRGPEHTKESFCKQVTR